MNKEKILIVAAVVLGLALIGLSMLSTPDSSSRLNEQDTGAAVNVTENDTQDYYAKLAEECKTKESESCCLASLEAMKEEGYTKAPPEGCPAGYQLEMLKCMDSYQWCWPGFHADNIKN